MGRTAVVFAGGDEPRAFQVPAHDYAVAADCGLELAIAAGVDVDLVIGDFDSVDPALLAGRPTERHPVDKDATDLELAVAAAVRAGCSRIVVIGAEGGRHSHYLAALSVLAAAATEDVAVEWRMSHTTIFVVTDSVAISGDGGELVSLLPVGGNVTGVVTEGLRWPLDDETLVFGTSRGVSNELLETTAMIRLATGVLAVVVEGRAS